MKLKKCYNELGATTTDVAMKYLSVVFVCLPFDKYLKKISWYEYLFLLICLATYITLSVVFKSGIIITLNALFGFLAVFFTSKGNVIGQILGIIQIPFYSYIAYSNRFFGELIICLVISLPICVTAIFSWAKNIYSSCGDIKVNTNISWKEWLMLIIVSLIVGVGIYFLLDDFNTYQVVLSTLSVITSAIAYYIVMRRNGYGFVFYIANNIFCMLLWIILVVENNDLSHIITFFNYIIYAVMNIRGIFNFIKLKQEQNRNSFAIIMKVLKE